MKPKFYMTLLTLAAFEQDEYFTFDLLDEHTARKRHNIPSIWR